ncbi:hypothetical protein [Sciscionella marina]|nr:hypothetical protein [Sciscionella marina]
MLEARVQGNHRAIEQETAYQEKAISKGELDPRRAPTVDYPGQSTTT